MQNIIVSYSADLLKLMGTKLASQVLHQKDKLPQIKMWQAVVLAAFEDVACPLSDKRSSIYKWEAFKWFHCKEDFEQVCYLADFEPGYVKERFQVAIDNEDIMFTQKQIAWAKYYEVLIKFHDAKDKKSKIRQIDVPQKKGDKIEDLKIYYTNLSPDNYKVEVDGDTIVIKPSPLKYQ